MKRRYAVLRLLRDRYPADAVELLFKLLTLLGSRVFWDSPETPDQGVRSETSQTCQWVFDLSGVGPSPAGLCLVEQTSVVLLWPWTVEDLADLETLIPKKSYYLSGLSPVRLNDHWNFQDNGDTRAKLPRRQQGICGSVRRGRGRDCYTQRRGARQVEGL